MFIPLQYVATLVLAYVIAKWQMEWPHIICCFFVMADVIAPVAYGMATAGCECFPPGRCYFQGEYIRVNNPSLNKNIGKYHLPHIWDEVLHNTSEFKLQVILPKYSSAPPGNNIYQEGNTHTQQWPFHLPQCNNICPTTNKQIICGHSICHLAITSANTRFAIYCSDINICHSKMAIKSALIK